MKIIKFLPLVILLSATSLSAQLPDGMPLQNSRQVLLPYDRIIQPAGLQIVFGNKSLENHALDAALSPDGKWLAVMERYSIVFINTHDNSIAFTLPLTNNPLLIGGMNTYSGITWHKGKETTEVYWSTTGINKRSFVASARWDGKKAEFGRLIEYKAEKDADMALPNEILITAESGREFLYVVLNGNNKVIKQDFEKGDTIWVTSPGVAPYGIALAAGRIYVTNWAGRFPEPGDNNIAGVPWGLARVDNNAGGSTREGSVAVIDPATGNILNNVIVGLHPNEIIAGKEGKYLYVTNSNSDNVSVISTATNKVTETINLRLQKTINPFFGDSPDGLCLSADNSLLYVANGMDNAVAQITLAKNSSIKGSGKSSIVNGFIPTGAYPSAICLSDQGFLYICNLESSGARIGLPDNKSKNLTYNSHHQMASLSVIPSPGKKVLKAYTDTVIAINDLERSTQSFAKARPDIKPQPVPERIGEPSVFKHVFYIIKENRTYDQVLGDMKKGDGNPDLCIYGADITPNTHKLCDEYILLDNFHASGKCSAEGHQWTDASIVTDYIEKNMRAWFRSYAHVQNDALVYAPTGFLWDNGLKNGKSVRIYGEASVPVFDTKMTWTDVYKKYINGEKVNFTNKTTLESVKKILSQTYPSYGNHEFSDAMRADAFLKEFHEYENMEGDKLPELIIMALPNDHANGLRPGSPTPRAMVADNDRALGLIVEAITKSRFWENTVIFVVEDDSQGGWDHVSAYRTVSMVISPYSRLKSVNHTYYNQPSMVRTIEQILGLRPMNIQDAIAKPMSDCFSKTPDLTPFKSLPAMVMIDEMNPQLVSLSGKALYYARKSMLPEFDKIDSGSDDLMNRILWFAGKGNTPYPSKYAGAVKDEREEND